MLREKVILQEKTELDTDLYKVVFALPDGKTVDFQPGQFMSIQVEGNMRRSYSLSNPPHQNTILETYADVSPHGPAYRFLEKAKVGDEVDVLAPLGRFTYQHSEAPAYFLGTGTGIVPFVSMIRHELETVGSGRALYLFTGVRNENRLLCPEIFLSLSADHKRFHYKQYLSQPEKETTFPVGRITPDIMEMTDPDAHYYICGGKDIITEIEQQLLTNGIPPQNIFYERYY